MAKTPVKKTTESSESSRSPETPGGMLAEITRVGRGVDSNTTRKKSPIAAAYQKKLAQAGQLLGSGNKQLAQAGQLMGLAGLGSGNLPTLVKASTSDSNNANVGDNKANTGDRWKLDSIVQTPRSPYEIRAGFIIPATLISGINSDLPGKILAQVAQDVFDTPTGHHVLIPQGARLFGSYGG